MVKVFQRGNVTPALQIPVYLINIWVIFGFIFTGIQYVLSFFQNLDFADPTIYLSYRKIDAYDVEECAEVNTFDQCKPDELATQAFQWNREK